MKTESTIVVTHVLAVVLAGLVAAPVMLSAASPDGYPCLESTTPLEEGAVEISQPCELHSDWVEMQKRCREDELDRDWCAWLATFQQLASGQVAAAEDELARAFGLSAPEAGRLRRAAQHWLPLVLDETSCPFESMRPLVEAMMASGVGAQPESTLVRLRLHGFELEATEQVLATAVDGEADSVARRFRAIESLVSLIGSNETVQEAARVSLQMPELSGRAALPKLEDWPPDLRPFAVRLEAVDEALATLPRESAESFFDTVEQAVAELPSVEAALVWVRAGIGLAMSGRAEDGALALHRAESLFRRSGELTAMARKVQLHGVVFRVLLSRYFQLNREAIRILHAAREGATQLERAFLENAACAPLTAAEIPLAERRAARFQQQLLRAVLADEIGEAERQDMMAATLIALPGLASSTQAPPPSLGLPVMLGAPEAMLIGDFARGMERWQALTLGSRHAEHLVWPALVTAAAVARGRIGAARRALERGIEHVEAVVAEQRSADVSRVTIDQVLARFYAHAVELAMLEEDVAGAFADAERGRSFALRRLLGARGAPPSRPSGEEQELELLTVSTIFRSAAGDLAELRSRFEAARWRRLLADSPRTPAPELVSLQVLQDQVLAPDEALVAYFPGVEKMWIWAIRRRQVETASVPWGPEIEREIHDGIAALRWSTDLGGARGSALRGGELLAKPAASVASEGLYDRLLAPIAGQLASASRVIVVPHGALHRVPFAALRSPTGMLAEMHEVTVVPSAGTLADLRGARVSPVSSPAEEIQ